MMKRLWLICVPAGLLLSSATPPLSGFEAAEPLPRDECMRSADCIAEAYAAAEVAEALAAPLEIAVAAAPANPPAPVEQRVPARPEPAQEIAAAEVADAPAEDDTGEDQDVRPALADSTEPGPSPGGVRVVISIPQQKAYVFKNGDLVATSPVSTGKRGHETPVGTFPILQKKVHHRSSKYDNAPMPYMQRLTHYGIALHAGSLPGYPASHGCIRLPRSFAKKLYGLTNYSTKVTVTKRRPKSAKDALRLA
jgi:lipoprotein-anchoring transpeptidase ErfK/SrfK